MKRYGLVTSRMSEKRMIWVDADACPVKDEIYKVAWRLGVPVHLVANAPLRIPRHDLISLTVVSDGFDAADDYIADRANTHCVVITNDILLADRCIKAGSKVLRPDGSVLDENNVGSAVATRAIMADLRGGADQVGYNAPFSKSDRSRFLQSLDAALVKLARQ